MFKLFGNTFRLYNEAGELTYYVKQKAFRLREDLPVYTSDGEIYLRIKARAILDSSGHFDFLAENGTRKVGSAKRNVLKSMFIDDWDLFDSEDHLVGKLQECKGALTWVRKFFRWIPQTFEVTLEGIVIGTVRQRLNLFQSVYEISFGNPKHHEIAIAIAVLVVAIESKYD